jgi:type II secretory pathway pseudopilin PulG
MRRSAFTLIELLVVIAITEILSVVVMLTLNPAELLRQSRDSTRIADMGTLNTALGIFSEDVGSSMASALGNQQT